MSVFGLVTRLYFVITQKLTEIRVAVRIYPYPTPEKRLCYEVIWVGTNNYAGFTAQSTYSFTAQSSYSFTAQSTYSFSVFATLGERNLLFFI
jgi:hypothetical protein